MKFASDRDNKSEKQFLGSKAHLFLLVSFHARKFRNLWKLALIVYSDELFLWC